MEMNRRDQIEKNAPLLDLDLALAPDQMSCLDNYMETRTFFINLPHIHHSIVVASR
ncbi:hypothetical protein CCACVL1_12451 [Corchorus capsularis]|uniref:Uncharacterized protein n=1 Tax=Corchorus capsularis TaxID=210143 RepID=A0A1R3IFK0_COCAP|nr:hypothetical protein CCACVL1_12451 [Corchorus capsularis]